MANTDHHIKVPGFRVDRVKGVVDLKFSLSSDFNRDTDSVDEAASLLEWEETCLQLSMGASVSKGVPDAHWRTLMADWTCQLSSEGALEELCSVPDSFRSAYDDFQQWLIDTRANSVRDGQRDQRSVKQFMASISRCQEKSFFKTCDNRVGLGPLDTQPGDVICVFYSAAPVFLLRPQFHPSMQEASKSAFIYRMIQLSLRALLKVLLHALLIAWLAWQLRFRSRCDSSVLSTSLIPFLGTIFLLLCSRDIFGEISFRSNEFEFFKGCPEAEAIL